MKQEKRQSGFSLTEVLMAAGVLAIGLTLIAMAFPVGVKLTAVSAEQTIADAATGEAIAGLRLYANCLSSSNLAEGISWPVSGGNCDYTDILSDFLTNPESFTEWSSLLGTDSQKDVYWSDARFYPSVVSLRADSDVLEETKRYCWSLLLRQPDSNTYELQTTVFVSRIIENTDSLYYAADYATTKTVSAYYPVPVKVSVTKVTSAEHPDRVLRIVPATTAKLEKNFFVVGSTILEDTTGQLCHVVELKEDTSGNRDMILLEDYDGPDSATIWVVPPAKGSSRNPCISVTQVNRMYP